MVRQANALKRCYYCLYALNVMYYMHLSAEKLLASRMQVTMKCIQYELCM